jgi:two-component system sensor histidine kinase KdpD
MTTEGGWRRDVLAVTGGLIAIGAIVVVLRLLQSTPNPTIAALLFLLVVFATATAASLRTAIALSAVAVLAFNFFLLPPLHTLSIADPQNWVVLVVFVIVAVIASQLSAAARERAREAETRKQEVTRANLASALLASFSHDLRTPVTSVRVAVTNLLDLALSPDERRAQARLAIEELDRLTRLFQNILDLARINASAVNPERQWVSPADVVDAAVAHVGSALNGHMLQVEADDRTELRIDPRLTSTALAHILENAARYSPDQTPIAIRGWADAEGGHFVVRDRGPGIEASDLDHLFEPFYRGRTARQATGTGLGLAITRGLLAAEDGRVWCDNVAGGAAFTIMVPGRTRVPDAHA